jgi:hypothetical protein
MSSKEKGEVTTDLMVEDDPIVSQAPSGKLTVQPTLQPAVTSAVVGLSVPELRREYRSKTHKIANAVSRGHIRRGQDLERLVTVRPTRRRGMLSKSV